MPTVSSGPGVTEQTSRAPFDYNHPTYRRAREKAFARSGGQCQFCGQRSAEHAHHWAMRYPPVDQTMPDDLTALCRECHHVATTTRRTKDGSRTIARFFIGLAAAFKGD